MEFKKLIQSPEFRALLVAVGLVLFSWPYLVPSLALSPWRHFLYLICAWSFVISGLVLMALYDTTSGAD
ncbi:MAG: hypothetical protein PHF00_04415 [Elusimicrobia bacterium]|nr:hypothetical protein [Elusimicrobiota bacterium]